MRQDTLWGGSSGRRQGGCFCTAGNNKNYSCELLFATVCPVVPSDAANPEKWRRTKLRLGVWGPSCDFSARAALGMLRSSSHHFAQALPSFARTIAVAWEQVCAPARSPQHHSDIPSNTHLCECFAAPQLGSPVSAEPNPLQLASGPYDPGPPLSPSCRCYPSFPTATLLSFGPGHVRCPLLREPSCHISAEYLILPSCLIQTM